MKLGGDPDEDIARFRLIREALDKECVIVGDANTGTKTFGLFELEGQFSYQRSITYMNIAYLTFIVNMQSYM